MAPNKNDLKDLEFKKDFTMSKQLKDKDERMSG